MRNLCSNIINQLVQRINNDSVMTVEARLVGSGAKKLITQNANERIDLDYNLCVCEVYEISICDGREIKEYIRKQFNLVLRKNGWGDCSDSTSVLSTKQRHFAKGNSTPFHMDLAIVRETCMGWQRLIHRKTGSTDNDEWYWNEAPHSRYLDDKVRKIKAEHLWQEVRDSYLEKKNMYLRRNDHDHPSFIVYIETINEIYSKRFGVFRTIL